MSDQELPDYYCAKCQHGLLESQVPGDPARCPKCKGLVKDFSIAHVTDVKMFVPKFVSRIEVRGGSVKGVQAADRESRGPIDALEPIIKAAKAFVVVEKVFNTIADRLENDGADPTLAVGADPSKLWLLGEALEAVGRMDAAEIAYQASRDHEG